MVKTAKKPAAGKTAAGRNKQTGKGSASSGRAAKPAKRTSPAKKVPKQTKNVSKKIPNGRTLQTRDEFFEEAGDYRKEGYETKGYYRKVAVVDSNKNNELAVIKLTTSRKGKKVPGEKKSKYRPFVETKDDEGNAIKIGKKFIENKGKNDLSPHAIAEMKKHSFNESRYALKNRKKVREMKGQKK